MSAQPTESRFDFNPSFAPKDYAEHKTFYQYLGATVIVLILITVGAVLFADIQPRINEIITGISGYLTNVYTEIISVVVTILILDRRAQNREEKRRSDDRNQRLIREIGSQDNATARIAIREAGDTLKGDNGLLKGANLQNANLFEVELHEVNLEGANLSNVNLSEAYLPFANLFRTKSWGINLSGAILPNANLSRAILQSADLSYADLQNVNLSGTNLSIANLAHARLRGANLSNTRLTNTNLVGADLSNPISVKNAILPDGTHWTSETDITRFTDRLHQEFWQPDWIKTGFHSYRDWIGAGRPNPNNPQQDWTRAGFDSWYNWVDAGKPIAPGNPTRD